MARNMGCENDNQKTYISSGENVRPYILSLFPTSAQFESMASNALLPFEVLISWQVELDTGFCLLRIILF